MICGTCMYFVVRREVINSQGKSIANEGDCRLNAPTKFGWPDVVTTDWCGNHKIDENKTDES